MSTPPHRRSSRKERPWLRGLMIGLAVIGLAAVAIAEGLLTGRWGASRELRAAATKLDGVPKTFGAWTSQDIPLDDKVVRVAEATGYVQRIYRHGKTGAEVTVLLLCGPPGPIGAHTPEYCYAGNGFAMAGEPEKKTIVPPGQAATSYWSARFEKKAPPSDPLRVCWMWGTDGDWEASANPRLGLKAALYKLYVVRVEPMAPRRGTDPVQEFLTEFLPEVKRALAAAPDPK
ncbi:MAG TPA: exosortase-associated EpsI family protein [Gemmata sp.]